MKATDKQLLEAKDWLKNGNKRITATEISVYLKNAHNIDMDDSTIRGRFIQMGEPLGGPDYGKKENSDIIEAIIGANKEETEPKTERETLQINVSIAIPDDLKVYIPKAELFMQYIERPVDKRLARHYDLGKYPLTQGKQGTGKTFSHMYYAFKQNRPFFLFSCHEDFQLEKLFGDKTIRNGTIVFQESEFVKAIQHPSVILFDEVNALSQANTFPFHALLQNRQLYIKDANDGTGKVFHLHPDCKIGFAQNPKSSKYIGGNIRSSNFLGRCTYLTYPEFTDKELHKALEKRYPAMVKQDREKFIAFYKGVLEVIEQGQLPIDISIRQLNNVIDLWLHGQDLSEALEDGLTSIAEAASQPKAKDALWKIATAVWNECKEKEINSFKMFLYGE